MTINLKAISADATFAMDAVFFGADSQSAEFPSVFPAETIWTAFKAQNNIWPGTNAFTGALDLSGGTITFPATIEAIKNLAVTDGNIIVGNGSTWVAESGATARTSLGLGASDSPSFASLTVSGTVDGRDVAADGTKLDGIESSADVTDTANVTAAGALMDSEVGSLSGIKTLTVPDSTTISTFAATLLDDPDAAAARSTLGVSAGGGDMAAATYDPAAIAEQLVGLTATQTLTNKTLTSPTINTPALGANSVDAITEISSSIRSGADGTLITGTAGSSGHLAEFNADGDVIGAGATLEQAGTALTRQVFTSSGTYTKPAGVTRIKAIVVGGGGAGGGNTATGAGQHSTGYGAPSGGVAIAWIDASDLGATETVTIGAGGTGASGAAGGNGGTTTFTRTTGADLVATGGEGGIFNSASASTFLLSSESLAGTATGGDINISGNPGGATGGTPSFQSGGMGGAGPFGGAGVAASSYSGRGPIAGSAASGPGSGGGGSSAYASQAATAGGNGAPGIVIIEEYYGA